MKPSLCDDSTWPIGLVERFILHVDFCGPTASPELGPCWVWTGGVDLWGYGKFQIAGHTWHANRVAWIIENGPIPEGQLVLHRCDEPACVRPSHFFLGDDSDNAEDRVAKDRDARLFGEDNFSAQLTANDVRELVRLAPTMSKSELARRFHVSRGNVRHILQGKTWSEVTGIQRSERRGRRWKPDRAEANA